MIKNNYHTHTRRCGHAIGLDEHYVQAAISAGMKKLGFSDHAPYDVSEPGIRMDYEDLEDYISSVNDLKERYKDEIEIYLGLETECYIAKWDLLKEYRERMDYMILGQHSLVFGKEDVYTLTNPAELREYVKRVEYAFSHSLCDCLAHPDLPMFSYPRIDRSVRKMAEDIADLSLKYDIPLEINCGSGAKIGIRSYEDGCRLPYPVRDIFEVFAEKKCRIMIGIDAHDPRDFLTDTYLNTALDALKGLDLKIEEDPDIIGEAKKRKEKYF